MKTLLLTLFLVAGCNTSSQHIKEATMTKIDPSATQSGIVEENDRCICTKEYRPVCGNNGVTYPSPCQAGCAGIKEFKEGNCQK